MSGSLANKTAIVTGASRGIGRAIVLHLASLDANLVVNYASNSALADQLVSQLNSNSPQPRAVAVQADVSHPSAAKSLFDAAEQTFNSQVHIFVNSAGIIDSGYSTISDISVEDFDRIFEVNTRGSFLCLKEASKRIVKGGGGRIITISSSLVAALGTNYGAYTASKAAVEALTKIMAKEMKGSRVTVNCVAPGAVGTDMFYAGKTEEMIENAKRTNPMGRIGETGDVVPVVGFLCGDEAEWINGQIIRVNGGYV